MKTRLNNVLVLVGIATIFAVQPFLGIAIVGIYLLKGK